MLKVRIIPTLLWSGFGLVKGTRFDPWRRVGPVVPAIEVYTKRDVDELMILDIDQSKDGTIKPDLFSITDFVRSCNVPLTYGGGIATVEDAVDVIQAGADKILINTHQYANKRLISDLAKRLGSQAVVVGIDARQSDKATYVSYSHCGTVQQAVSPAEAAKIAANEGAGEIVITSIDRDGTLEGYDLELISTITAAVRIPVIASGGARDAGCFVDAVQTSGASAVAAGAAFHFTALTPDDARTAMRAAGIPVRQVLHDG
jgi:cyclase